MSIEFNTPFTDRFFQVERRITYFTLGAAAGSIFEHFKTLDLSRSDCCRLLEATGIDIRSSDWCMGTFEESVVICGQLYPKKTFAIVQGRTPGKRLAIFSTDDADFETEAGYDNA